jgi:hypothetical protein
MADDERDPQVAQWLAAEPLDDLSRRRLVTTAMRESESYADPAPPRAARSSRAWRWIAAAAAVVVVLAVGLALLSANGGHDEEQATRHRDATVAPKAAGSALDAGDFGNLDDPANLAALRAALARDGSSAPLSDSSTAESSAGAQATAPTKAPTCSGLLPAGTVVARATGTLDGRTTTVFLVERDDGARHLVAVLEHPCAVRDLGAG